MIKNKERAALILMFGYLFVAFYMTGVHLRKLLKRIEKRRNAEAVNSSSNELNPIAVSLLEDKDYVNKLFFGKNNSRYIGYFSDENTYDGNRFISELEVVHKDYSDLISLTGYLHIEFSKKRILTEEESQTCLSELTHLTNAFSQALDSDAPKGYSLKRLYSQDEYNKSPTLIKMSRFYSLLSDELSEDEIFDRLMEIYNGSFVVKNFYS